MFQAFRHYAQQNKKRLPFFFQLLLQKRIHQNKFADEIHLIKSCSRFTTPITQEEITNLLTAISKSTDTFSQRDKALFAVYAFSGIRKSEALALRISDYDRDSKLLHLPIVKRSSKNFQTIPSILSNILDDYLPFFKNTDSSLPLFPGIQLKTQLSSRQAGLSGRQVSYRFEKWKVISGIRRNLTIHSFRAAYASQLYKKTKDPLLVSYALGHTSFNTTMRYINEEFFDIFSVIEEVFNF
ncbi:MAG: site-specific integrase [Melioribacter sp.]|nr:site-specific integrase [Melioribacter sp.]